MAAEIHPKPLTRRPVLLNKIEGSQDVVNTAVIIPKEDGVISVSEDRTIRIWLKRDSGQYWPSVYHSMPSPCSCMSFNQETRRLSVGMDNGFISEFVLAEDYNKMTPDRTFQAHQGRVTVVLFVLEMEWVLSTGQDKNFNWHCSESGQRLGGYRTTAWVSCLQYPCQTECSVTALCWDPVQRVLFSGSSDHSIIMWDIGGKKGTAIELQGHNEKVQGLCYAHHTRQLISCSSDGGIVIWNMDVQRQEHHCRKCGKALCGKCSSKRSTIPLMGFEFEVRVCDSCHESITDEDRAPTATFHDSKHSIIHIHYEVTRSWLLTSGADKIIKVSSKLVQFLLLTDVIQTIILQVLEQMNMENDWGLGSWLSIFIIHLELPVQ
ncbi:UNVERIFIED_CONTAM: hypothetical protein FKN15_016883 [Acipenser sinensis]